MSEEIENLGILLDTSKAMEDLRAVENKKQEIDAGLKKTQQNTRDTVQMAITAFEVGWDMTRGVLKLAGISISGVTNAIVRSVFAIGKQLYTLATSQAVTPGMQWAAALTFVQAGITIASAIAYENESQQAMRTIEGTNMIISNVNWIIGRLNY